MMMDRGEGLWRWWLSILLPVEPLPDPDTVREQAMDVALQDAAKAHAELQQLKRRARAVGIDVDVQRSWGPKDRA